MRVSPSVVQQGIAVGVAETFDNPVIAAAVTSAIGGGLRGESFIQGGLTGAAIGGVQLVGVKNNWDPALTNVAALTIGELTMGSLRGFEGDISVQGWRRGARI